MENIGIEPNKQENQVTKNETMDDSLTNDSNVLQRQSVAQDVSLYDSLPNGVMYEVDGQGNKWRIDPDTKERIEIIEPGNTSED